MTKSIFSIFIATILFSCSPSAEAPAPVHPIPTPQQVEWQKMEQYAFVHFGLNTFNDLEWGFGNTPAQTFNPTNLDIKQWIDVIKKAGLKGVILTAKHHDGFCLWQTKYTDYSVASSPWKDGKGDVVRELVDACKENNLKVGLYLSPWDRNHAEYGREEYAEYFKNQIEELINEYCDDVELFEYWFDGANGGDGYYGGANESRQIDASKYYQYEECVDIIHEKFPNAMIFGGTVPTIRWIGNESGWAGQTNWATYDSRKEDARILPYGIEGGNIWLPGEVDVSIRPGWFYHQREDHQLHSLSKLVDIYYQSVGRNSNLLLNFPVALNGTIHPADSIRVIEWWQTISKELEYNLLENASVTVNNTRGKGFKASNINDGDWDSYWATEDGVTSGDVEFTFKKTTELNRVLLQEYIPLGQRVKSFSISYLDNNNQWQSVPTKDSLTTVGYKRIIRFANIKTNKLKISFLDARGPLTINNIEAFLAPALLVEPMIRRDSKGIVTIKGGDAMSNIYYTLDGTTPTADSPKYTAPFELKGKGTVRAISQDLADVSRLGSIATKEFDVLTSAFTVAGNPENKSMFDSNQYSNYQINSKDNSVTIILDKEYTISGFKYLPNQTRWGGGIISRYEIYSDNKKIASGEFSNIKANPIEQIVKFSSPIKSSKLKFVAIEIAAGTGKRGEIAEFSIITE